MAEYQHGGDIYSQKVELDYSANISPLGMPESVRQAVRQAVDRADVYPDSRCDRLRRELADFHGVKKEMVICGNGAADLIFQMVLAAKPVSASVMAPGFSEYEQALKAFGCPVVRYMLKKEDGFQFSLEDWEKALPDHGGIAFFCNPNNPTGLTAGKETVRKMAEICRDRKMILVIDECFNEFLDQPESCSFLDQAEKYENVFILKAFTKLYAMAGLRLGYGICANERLLEQMELVRQPWSVSTLAQAGGMAALKETEYVKMVQKTVKKERDYLKSGLRALGFRVWDSKANYIFFQGSEGLKEKLLERRVLIRSCGNYHGLDGTYYRICVKTREDNEKLLGVLEEEIG